MNIAIIMNALVRPRNLVNFRGPTTVLLVDNRVRVKCCGMGPVLMKLGSLYSSHCCHFNCPWNYTKQYPHDNDWHSWRHQQWPGGNVMHHFHFYPQFCFDFLIWSFGVEMQTSDNDVIWDEQFEPIWHVHCESERSLSASQRFLDFLPGESLLSCL